MASVSGRWPGQLKRWATFMTSERLDELILSYTSPQWQKVAMVIARVSYDERFEPDESADKLTHIANRIAGLIDEGRLVAQGDISNWRHSEIRLAG